MRSYHVILLATFLLPRLGAAQDTSPSEKPSSDVNVFQETGPVAFAEFQGSATPLGTVMSGSATLGFNLTSHVGGDVGLPVYWVRSPFSLVSNHDWRWTNVIGDPYVAVHYTTSRFGFDVTSMLMGLIPVANNYRIYSTGRFGVDWFNHVERHYGSFTPFLNFGASNGATDRFLMPRPYSLARPYSTLGVMADFEGGGSYKVWRGYKIGASAYALVPEGPQKVFSRFVYPTSSVASDGNHNRYFDATFETAGPSRIARDNGYSGWIEVGHFQRQHVTVQLGYTRSVRYAYDAFTLMLNFNGTFLLK